MRRSSRRKSLALIGSVGGIALAGCLDELSDDTSEEEDLREQWEENDDYPDDDFRNLSLGRPGFAPILGTDGRVETTLGTHQELVLLGVSREYHRSMSVEVFFESSKPVDVYAIPGQIETEQGEQPDLSEYEHIPEYSEFGIESYHEIFETTEEDENYTLLITLEDFRPPQSIQEELDFVEEREEAVLEGWTESAAYVPFEEYKDSESVQITYDDTDLDDL